MNFLRPGEELPSVEAASPQGLLAVGGELSVQRLVEAYYKGIFPWYDVQPVLWWSPDPRMVLFPENLRISKSMKQVLRKNSFAVSFNTAFKEVMLHCARIQRPGQQGTWITPEIIQTYQELHQLGKAISVEVWQDGELVGGLYGVYLRDKKVFCGESMFAKVSNASKFGFIKWVEQLRKEGVRIIDCQVHTPHLARLGGEEIPRREFLKFLQ